MNCHGNNKNQQGSHKHSPLKHLLHMAICCGLPIIILAALPLISGFSPAAAVVLGKIAPFLCPLMMIAMLPMMFGGSKKESCCDGGHTQGGNEQIGSGQTSNDINMVVDPECGMYINPDTAIRQNIDGKTYYFCSENCRGSFVEKHQ